MTWVFLALALIATVLLAAGVFSILHIAIRFDRVTDDLVDDEPDAAEPSNAIPYDAGRKARAALHAVKPLARPSWVDDIA